MDQRRHAGKLDVNPDLPEHIAAWIGRMGSMEFVDDQKFGDTDRTQPAYEGLARRLGVFEYMTLFL